MKKKGEGPVVLEYMGEYEEQWSCVPARDLTQEDIDYIVNVVRGPSVEDILRMARTFVGGPLYVRVEEKQEVRDDSDT